MDAFVSRKRKRTEAPRPLEPSPIVQRNPTSEQEEESTDFKLALLASLHANADETTLLEALLASDGSVERASTCLAESTLASPRKRSANAAVGYQSSLSLYRLNSDSGGSTKKPLVKKGKTLYLFSPEDIEQHTPCSIIHNFLPPQQANALLQQLLDETPTYQALEFKLFDRVVTSPHTFCFYVNSLAEAEEQKTEYVYDGRKIEVGQADLSATITRLTLHRTSAKASPKCSKPYPKSKKPSTRKSSAESTPSTPTAPSSITNPRTPGAPTPPS